MLLQDQTDHVAILSLMLVGVLIKRLHETGQLDDATARQIHQLVGGVRTHADHAGLADLKILFDNIDQAIGLSTGAAEVKGERFNVGTIPLCL